VPFYVEKKQVGILRPLVVLVLQEHPEIFSVSNSGVHLNSKYATCEERTDVMKEFLEKIREAGKLNESLKGWRNEVIRDCSGGRKIYELLQGWRNGTKMRVFRCWKT
jgi:hypothetical protein